MQKYANRTYFFSKRGIVISITFLWLDDMDDDTIANPGDLDVAQSPTNLRYSTGGRRFHRPRPHHRQHWVNENNLARLNGKGIIRHKEGEDEEINDDGFHAAGE